MWSRDGTTITMRAAWDGTSGTRSPVAQRGTLVWDMLTGMAGLRCEAAVADVERQRPVGGGEQDPRALGEEDGVAGARGEHLAGVGVLEPELALDHDLHLVVLV